MGWGTFPALSQGLFDGPVDRLPPIERAKLREGRVVVTGSNGKYTARVLVNATLGQVWAVLTDYGNLSKFIPNMASSKVLEERDGEKIVEQIDSRQVLLVTVVSRTVLAIREENLRKINFRLTAGDLQSMEGSWQIEPVSFVPRTPPTQVLITHTVSVQPQASIPASTFYEIFAGSLRETLSAIAQEVKRRQG
jgi:ribosome-associated toxin RatA of RatAB toxin-antitoxin module